MSGRRVRQPGVRPGSPRWSQTPAQTDDGQGVYALSRLDPLVRSASPVIGGPAGRRLASATGFWRAAPVLVLLSAVALGLGVVQKQHCRTTGWASPDQFWHACYSDIPVVFSSAGLGGADRLDLSSALGSAGLGQPPLAGLLMWVTSGFVDGTDAAANRSFFDLTALLLAGLLGVAVAAVTFTLGRRGWDAAHLAVSPVLIFAGLLSYQILAIALVALALFALSRARALTGGILLGLGVAAAPQVAVIALVVAVLALWRSGSYLNDHSDGRDPRSPAGITFAGSTLVSWLVVRVLLLPGLSGQFGDVLGNWRSASPGYGSLWLVPQLLSASEPDPATSRAWQTAQLLLGWLFSTDALGGTVTAALVLLALLAGTVLLLVTTVGRVAPLAPMQDAVGTVIPARTAVPPTAAPPTAVPSTASADSDEAGEPTGTAPLNPAVMRAWVLQRVAPASLAALALVLVTAKALPAQTSLLLLPLIALSGLRWRDHLIWAGTEAVYFVGIWLYIGGETTANRGLPAQFYLIMLLARLAGIAWVGFQGALIYRASAVPARLRPEQGPFTGSLSIREISSPGVDEGSLLGDRDFGPAHFTG